MNKQLKGIGFILFGISLMMFAKLDPYIPILESVTIILWIGLICLIIGFIFLISDKS